MWWARSSPGICRSIARCGPGRLGVHLDRLTLASWVKPAAWWLKSLYEVQLRTIHAPLRIFCDETPMPVIDPGSRRSRICPFWPHATDDRSWGGPAPPAVAYVFADGRGTAKVTPQLAGFSGILQALQVGRSPVGNLYGALVVKH